MDNNTKPYVPPHKVEKEPEVVQVSVEVWLRFKQLI